MSLDAIVKNEIDERNEIDEKSNERKKEKNGEKKKGFVYTNKHKIIFEIVYYLYLTIFISKAFLITTKINITKFNRPMMFAIIILGILLLAKVALEWRDYWSYKEIIIGILTAGLLIISNCKLNIIDIFAISIAILGARNIDKKRLMGFFAILVYALTIMTVSLCLAGKIQNFTFYRDASMTIKRYAMGFTFVTYLPAYLMSASIAWLYFRDKKISYVEGALFVIMGAVCYYLTNTRISSAVLIAVGILAIIYKIFALKDKTLKFLRAKAVKFILVFGADIIAIASIVMGYLYKTGSSFWSVLDKLTSSRTFYNGIALHRYPVTLFGSIVFNKTDYQDNGTTLSDNFFIINTSYVKLLIVCGIVGFLGLMIAWTVVSYREVLEGKYINAICLFMFSCYLFFEPRMNEIAVTPFLILPLAGKEIPAFTCFTRNFFAKIKKSLRKSKLILTFLVISLVIEIVGFNYKALSTYLNESILFDKCTIFTDDFTANENSLFDVKKDTTIILGNIMTYTGMESMSAYVLLYSEGDYYEYKYLNNAEYDVDVLVPDEEGNFVYDTTFHVKANDYATSYLPYEYPGMVQLVELVFHFPENVQCYPLNIGFNEQKPFDISFLRILLMWAGLCVVFYGGKFVISHIDFSDEEDEEDSANDDDSKEDSTNDDDSKEDKTSIS